MLRSQWALQRLENVLCYEVSDLSIFRPGGLLDLEMLTADHEALQSLSISTQPREANHEAKTMLTVARGRSYYRNILYKVYPDLAREGAPPYYKHVTTRWVQQTREHTKNPWAKYSQQYGFIFNTSFLWVINAIFIYNLSADLDDEDCDDVDIYLK